MILDRYLLGKLLTPLLYCVLGFVSVWLVWDMGANLPDFLSGHATFPLVARYYLLQLPSVLVLSIPVGLLLALLYTLTQMSRRNEIISMLCAGRSLWRIFAPLFAVGLVATGMLFLLNRELAPGAVTAGEKLKSQIKSGVAPFSGLSNHLYRNREDRRLWFLGGLFTRENQAVNVEIIQQDPYGSATEKWYALHAVYDPGSKSWHLDHVRHVTVDTSGNLLTSESLPVMDLKGWNETPWKIASSRMAADDLGLPELGEYLRSNAEFPAARLAPFVTHWHYRWALPWICMAVILIAGPLGIVTGRRGILGGVGMAVVLFAAMLLLNSLFLALGKGHRIPGWVAGWGSLMVFSVIGFFLLWVRATGREMPRFRLPGL
jgi:lipopolysaccharide export system permease protein